MKNVLLVTATKIEIQAVQDLFSKASGQPWERRKINDKIYYAIGTIGGVNIFAVQSEMGTVGPGASLLTVHEAIRALSPSAVIMVGIAFGTDPEKQELGEILISEQLQSYEPQKIKENGTIPRGDRTTASTWLLDKFRSGDLDWGGANVHFGLMLSGEKLVKDASFRDSLIAREPEAIGGEMEGAGLYVAAQTAKVDWIIVKAICDWGDANKGDEYQHQAARNAADFVLHVIQQGGLISEPAPKKEVSKLWQKFGIVDMAAEWNDFCLPTEAGINLRNRLKEFNQNATWYIITINPVGFMNEFRDSVILPALKNNVKMKWAYVRLPDENDSTGKILRNWWASQFPAWATDFDKNLSIAKNNLLHNLDELKFVVKEEIKNGEILPDALEIYESQIPTTFLSLLAVRNHDILSGTSSHVGTDENEPGIVLVNPYTMFPIPRQNHWGMLLTSPGELYEQYAGSIVRFFNVGQSEGYLYRVWPKPGELKMTK